MRPTGLILAGIAAWLAAAPAMATPPSPSIGLLTASLLLQQGPPPAAVRVDAVRMESVQEQRLVTGELRAVQRSRVATEEPGLAVAIPVQEGQRVKKGDVLARLNSQRLEIELLQAAADEKVAIADVGEMQADRDWRKRDLENYQSLAAGGAGKAKELYDAEMQVRIAEAKLESARRNVEAIAVRSELLRQRIADATIVAPFDGVIVTKLAEEGEWLAEGAAVAEMIGSGAVDAWLDVPQQYAEAMLGRTPLVTINVQATGRRIETADLRVIPQVDPRARTFAVVVRLDNREGLLAPGMSVTAYVPTGEQAQRLTISRDAIMRSATGEFVYVSRQADPKAPPSAMPADVQALFSAGERIVVQSPMLQPGDLVVVEGNERLFPTAPILPQPVDVPKDAAKNDAPEGAPDGAQNRPGADGAPVQRSS